MEVLGENSVNAPVPEFSGQGGHTPLAPPPLSQPHHIVLIVLIQGMIHTAVDLKEKNKSKQKVHLS